MISHAQEHPWFRNGCEPCRVSQLTGVSPVLAPMPCPPFIANGLDYGAIYDINTGKQYIHPDVEFKDNSSRAEVSDNV
jgi:hypothetical protein